jgi:hypothetical protein
MSWGEMTGAQALSRSTRGHSIEVMKMDRRTVSQHVCIQMFIDHAPQLEIILYGPKYKDGFGKSNAECVFRSLPAH